MMGFPSVSVRFELKKGVFALGGHECAPQCQLSEDVAECAQAQGS